MRCVACYKQFIFILDRFKYMFGGKKTTDDMQSNLNKTSLEISSWHHYKGHQQKGNSNYFLFALSFNNIVWKKKPRTSEIQPRFHVA